MLGLKMEKQSRSQKYFERKCLDHEPTTGLKTKPRFDKNGVELTKLI